MSTPAPAPWHAAFPPPTSAPTFIPASQVLQKLTTNAPDFILIDLRRADHEGGTISGSLNLPAQTLYPSLPTLYTLFKSAGVKEVIFYCGSSQGRGSRAAGWMMDYIISKGDREMVAVALEGGIKGWVKAGGEFVKLVVGYEGEVWKKYE